MRHTQTQGRITYIDDCLGETIMLWGLECPRVLRMWCQVGVKSGGSGLGGLKARKGDIGV
jgi:hypothetical protein